MRKVTLLLSFCMLFLTYAAISQNSDKITRVLEYKPAPGQHINRLFPPPAMSDTPENALQYANNQLINNKTYVGLGAYGGYVIVGFDHSIINVPGEYDFKALGNAFVNSAEPGIVMVCQDLNKNGVPDPDEPWYELAGSEYNHTETIKNYEITYYRPDPDKTKSNIRWTDNQGGEGVITHISFASQATMYPLWIADNTLTFKGSKLRNNMFNDGIFKLPAFDWGYVDNHANNSTIDKIGFNIEWAVDDSGNPVHLEYIDFIKVYTGLLQEAGSLGETSTEFAGIVDLHPDATLNSYPPVGADYFTLDLENTTTLAGNPLAPNSHWADTYTEDIYLESQIFILSHRSGWGGFYWDGFTISNHTDNSDHGQGDSAGWVENQWGSMTKGGVNGEGSNFLVAYWGSFNDEDASDVTETSNFVMFNDGKEYEAVGTYVTNAPWPYYSILNGDQFARKFEQGDYFKVIATGFEADGVTETGKTEFYLADYRSVNPTQWILHDTWQWMDLSTLGKVSYIQFTMDSSDAGDWGINTSTHFAMDKLTVRKTTTTSSKIENSADIQTYRSGNKLYNLPEKGMVQVYSLNGSLVMQSAITGSEMALPSNALYIIRISSDLGVKVIR